MMFEIKYSISIIFLFSIFSFNFEICLSAKDSRCVLPAHPVNGHWSISGYQEMKHPGNTVSSGSVINVECNGKYTLDGSSLIECKNGIWKSKIGKCLELCPPIIPTFSTNVTCTLNRNKTNCMKARNGTIATFTCAQFYENAELNRNPFRTCVNGKWNQEIPFCTAVCGLKPKPLKKGAKIYYPWNTSLFLKIGNDIVFTCGGTLINERTIITVGHCITNDTGFVNSPSNYTIGVGKSTYTFNDVKDSQAQFSDVQDMFVPQSFKGFSRRYVSDMAVIIVKEKFKITERVQPACVDWSDTYAEYFENPDEASLSIAGPLYRPHYPFLENSTIIPIKLVNETQCYDQLSPKNVGDRSFEAYFAPLEMYCADYIDETYVRDCILDVGVGLVSKNQYNDKYYVIGVLKSFSTIHHESCKNKRWTLYIKLSQYLKFIDQKINLYAPIRRQYFQTSCGIKSVKAQTLIVKGKNVTKGDYPWQTAIYQLMNNQKILTCGGSLLNQRVILTAAHCVADIEGNPLDNQNFAVAVGKYYRNFNDPRDTKAQFSSVKHIYIPSHYKGDIQNYQGDIAILISETSFTLSNQVQPVCVDWDVKYEDQFLKSDSVGYVTGWGYTKENQEPSEELKELQVPYVDQKKCKWLLPPDYEIYLTSDKLCAGFLNEGKSVCSGDSGGGLVFKNANDDRYYIAGVVSLAPQAPTGGCNSQQYALYTQVSAYVKQFISETVRLYWA